MKLHLRQSIDLSLSIRVPRFATPNKPSPCLKRSLQLDQRGFFSSCGNLAC